MNYEPFTTIENLTLAHFRQFSSLFTLSHLYTCRESSTNQLLFMQNKPNLVRLRRIANSVCTMNYEIFLPLAGQKNKPNSNPTKPNFQKAKMNINSFITRDYRKNDDFEVRINKPNSNPISERPKTNATLFTAKDYENETTFRLPKNKPNLSRRSLWRSRIQTQSPKGQKRMQPSLPQRIMKIKLLSGSQKTNPTCRGVASGEAGFKPNFSREFVKSVDKFCR